MEQRGQNDQDQPGYGQQQWSTQQQWGTQPQQWPQQSGQFPQYGDQPPQQPAFPGYPPPQASKKNTGVKIAGFGCLGVVAVVVIVVIAALAVGSKNGTNVDTTAANAPAANTATAGTAGGAAPATSAKKAAAGLGDTIDVTDVSGDKLAVTLVKVDAGTKATDGFSSPDSGNQYYAAQFQIKNVGSSAWSDAPSNCTVVKDGKGQTFQATILESISSGPMMADTANLAAGDSVLGWIVFEVPKGDKVTTVQFTPLSGMDDNTAQWSLS